MDVHRHIYTHMRVYICIVLCIVRPNIENKVLDALVVCVCVCVGEHKKIKMSKCHIELKLTSMLVFNL